ncbi:la-related protein 1C-like isoform X2 [Olea europaea var. sylvestris]|uniref:la-related protein 1C-like isoform X2 n=1 Tax=Olea europaea var. sylvestris TaxID=158386 RepID=UPI000C1D8597|nr:la-related protein 1C-like isoform X2 [Olea europaea var. sylvestris]
MATATNPIPSSSSAHQSPSSPNSRWAGSSPLTQIVRDCDSDYIISSSSSSITAAVAVNGISLHSPSLSSVVAREANANSSSSDSSPSGAASTLVAVAGSMTCPTVESAAAAAETPPENTENGGGSSNGSNATKKPAWNKPSNGATAEISAVMGAESWPALSESTRASTKKSSSSDSLKALSDGTVSLQGTGVGFSSTYKQETSSNTNPNLTPHNVGPTRQRSMKHVGGGMSNSDGSASDYVSRSLPPEGAAVELVSNNLGKSGGSAGESSARDITNRESGQSGGSHGGNVLQHQRNSFRRGSGGPHPRGDVAHYHGRGGRRDRERGNQDWDTYRNFGSREGNMPQQRVASRPFIRGPASSTPYISPPPLAVRPPFGTPMVYTGTQPDSLRMPMVPIRPMFFPVTDPHLSNKIMYQIDYYFSNENLVKDTFLRQNMDEEGWVPIQLIAGFRKVMELTDNIQLILEAVQASNIVEVQVDKVRRKNDWMKWIMRPIQM